jgi:hypothetical protein
MLTFDPIVQELLWRGIAQRGVSAPAVVERLDVVEGVGNRLGSRFVAGTMHPLVLEAVEEALGRRVIPAVPFRLIEQIMPYPFSRAWKAWLAYWLPRSE